MNIFINRRLARIASVFLLLLFLTEIIYPTAAYALTGGPSQPEVESFEPVGTSEMVDLATGDFNYNIPLLDVGGYPLNIAYHAGIGMDQEASIVGLGWNINPGVINRSMRGLPDDFNGELIKNTTNIKPNRTLGLGPAQGFELFGFESDKLGLSANFGIFHNNYKGFGIDYSLGIGFEKQAKSGASSLDAGLSLSGNSQTGVDISADAGLSFSKIKNNKDKTVTTANDVGLSSGARFNSRTGLEDVTFGVSAKHNKSKNTLNESGEIVSSKTIANGGTSISGSHSFSAMTYQPNVQGDMRSSNLSFNYKGGVELWGLKTHLNLKGYLTSQWLKAKGSIVEKEAYGYYYEQNKESKSDVLLDLNRERDVAYNKYAADLPLANHTFDIYSASGQGVGGSYRLFRSDVPILHSDDAKSSSIGLRAGGEVGTGGLAKFGGNIGANWGFNKSSKLEEVALNKFGNVLFNDQKDFEPAYFKASNQINKVDPRQFDNMKGLNPFTFIPNSTASGLETAIATKDIETDNYSFSKPSSATNNTRISRDPRANLMSSLTGGEASVVGLDKEIKDYAIDWNSQVINQPLNHTSVKRNTESAQFSEMSITSSDGSRYIYGIPAMNNIQMDVTFNVAGRTKYLSTGQVTYFSGTSNPDNSTKNKLGNDEYYNKKEIPAYAHSYLLTGVLSPDYVDISGDGISDDDFGTAVKFNYAKIHDNYKWRVPYNTNKANLMDIRRSFDQEDKGSYTYGEKEYWIIHSIETKNNVAIFKYRNDRHDGFGVAGENGGRGNDMSLRYLETITLYAKQDYMRDEVNAVPIKTVHFSYDYSLSQGIDNSDNGGGKLTLKKLWFTYGKSNKGRMSSYVFTYSSGSANPSYNFKGSDAWGSYKENKSSLYNTDFPFAEQTKSTADLNAAAWALKSIKLPSGGVINIEYESDDYGYVQDERAMRMFELDGFTNSSSPSHGVADLFYNNNDVQYDAVVFDLKSNLSGSATQMKQELFDRYIAGMEHLQFTVYIDVDGQGNYEYIKGYCEVDPTNYGVIGNNKGWIGMKKVELGDKRSKPGVPDLVNPVAKYCWNYAKIYLPNLIYPASEVKENPRALLSAFRDLKYMFTGFYSTMIKRGFCQTVDRSKSWIRLYEPDRKKLGGGHRVKSIKLSDNWSKIDGSASFDYGQTYQYTTTAPDVNGVDQEISSGVASFEPLAASDENPFTQPRFTNIKNIMVPNDMVMSDEIIGNSFYPGASVVYSKVTVTPLSHSGVKRTAAGYQVHEFFTAKDYPTIVEKTDIRKQEKRPNVGLSLFGFSKASAVTAQGYSIILNDMHGKTKSQFTYAEGKSTPIAGTSFLYYTDENDPSKLDNEVVTMNKSGTLSTNVLGLEIDYNIDSRQSESNNYSAGGNLNLDVIPFFIPLPIGSVFPQFSYNGTAYKSAVVTKVVKQYGLLKRTIAHKNGSTLFTDNRVFSDETGEVLLTATQNEYEDFTYSFSYPAYWVKEYDRMGPAYENQGITINDCSINGNGELSTAAINFLKPGDECLLNGYLRVYVHDANSQLNLIDDNGQPVLPNGTFSLKVIRSGNRNQLNAKAGSVQTLNNPQGASSLSFSNVLNASAMEYSEDWKTYVGLNSIMSYSESDIGEDWKRIINENIGSHVNDGCVQTFVLYPMGASVTCRINGGSPITITVSLNPIKCQDLVEVLDPSDNTWKVVNLDNPLPTSNLVRVAANNLTNSGTHTINQGSPLLTAYNQFTNDPNCNIPNQTAPASSSLLGEFINGKYQLTTVISMINQCDIQDGCRLTMSFQDDLDELSEITSVDRFYGSAGGTLADVIIKDKNGVSKTVVASVTSPCLDLAELSTECHDVFIERAINPYRSNLKGNWRPERNYVYMSDRNQSSTPNLRTDGGFSSYSNFWSSGGSDGYDKTANSNWVWSSEITEYTPYGNEVENRDALGRYSSSIYGYSHQVPIAVASNARYSQIAYDGFEDYNYQAPNALLSCDFDHMSYKFQVGQNGSMLDHLVKHSGKYSMKLPANNNLDVTRTLSPISTSSQPVNQNLSKKLTLADDIGVFKPAAGEYIISGWVKEDASPFDTTYSQAKIVVELGSTSIDCIPSGKIIEGWQRIEKRFTISSGAPSIKIKLVGAATTTWFDDIRVFPATGNMKTYAYDAKTLRLMAEMDENNYATFYEYDLEGNLIRIKKETIEGIKTLQESRNHSSHVN